jgi:2-methylcitrate dehydratase PrpD
MPNSVAGSTPGTPNALLADFICGFDERELPEAARERAVSAILDTFAVTVAGRPEEPVSALAASVPVGKDPAACTTSWFGQRYRSDDAALLIGTSSHALDYDDVSMTAICHPSAPVFSALLAMIGTGDAHAPVTGGALIAAFCIGTEVLIKTGQAMGFRHYELGFHATATLGTLGATAALARLEGLDRQQTGHAMSIAASMAGGLRTNFGSMVKPLHVGLAAANGVRAVQMARAGMTGAPNAFEGGGLLHALSGGATDRWPADLRWGEPFVLQTPGFEQKRYPCCYILHKVIEACLSLREAHGLTLDAIEKVRVRVPHGATKPLNHPFPRTGLNGKFSGPYAVVASILDGRIGLGSFLDAAVQRTEVQSRLADVELVEEGPVSTRGSDIGSAPFTVDVTLRDGTSRSRTVVLAPGSPDDPITPAQLREKWLDCFEHGRAGSGPAHAGALFAQGAGLAAMPAVAPWFGAVLAADT